MVVLDTCYSGKWILRCLHAGDRMCPVTQQLWEREGSRIGQRVRMGCGEVSPKVSADPGWPSLSWVEVKGSCPLLVLDMGWLQGRDVISDKTSLFRSGRLLGRAVSQWYSHIAGGVRLSAVEGLGGSSAAVTVLATIEFSETVREGGEIIRPFLCDEYGLR